eukprot:TRINITY_DN45889_c0_g1_i1.p1 TRINITY_DN45889_c0_g1~~TRINITY_DN45889_c0_g1_i1.p1  ORF type:complete len:653 (-),score=32.93 TRINITY_DN45889_c0_g1_i1:256-2148(-)
MLRSWTVTAAACMLSFLVAATDHGMPVPVAQAVCGPVRGTVDHASGSVAYLGIPYALPPVGMRRWRPPVGVGTVASDGHASSTHRTGCWTGVLDGSLPGPPCLQSGEYAGVVSSSEDCLRLHVHSKNMKPAGPDVLEQRQQLNPVLVWLHGGGLIEGSPFALQSGFGAQANLTAGNEVVVVSVQYRLGVAGFLSLASLSHHHDPRGISGNYGLLDCLEALRWIQANIPAFGGDPGRVTVWGQSSGGSLVLALAASPHGHGLFHGGISMSGSPRLNSTVSEAALYWHRQVVERTPCARIGFDTTQEDALARCLVALSPEDLLLAMPSNWHADVWSLDIFQPSWQYAPLLLVDGEAGSTSVLPVDYLTSFSSSRGPRVPLVLGATRQESDFAPGDDVRNLSRNELVTLLRSRVGESKGPPFMEELTDVYRLETRFRGELDPFEPQRVYAEILSDTTTVCPNFYLAAVADSARRTSAGPPVYAYAASRRLSHPFCVLQPFNHMHPQYCPLYAFHAVDEFVMLQPSYSLKEFPYNFSEEDIAYGQLLRDRVIEFVSSGSVSEWHRFAGAHPGSTLTSNAGQSRELPQEYSVVDMGSTERNSLNYLRDRCNLWLKNGFYDSRGLVNFLSYQEIFT